MVFQHDAETGAKPVAPELPRPSAAPTPPGATEPLDWELPDDWASLKPARRTEPVFDDDNGLDAEPDPLLPQRPGRAADAPVASDRPTAKPAPAVAAPAPSAQAAVSPRLNAAVDDELPLADFEWRLDKVEAASAKPASFGDWQHDQQETVAYADDDDHLNAPPPAGNAALAAEPNDEPVAADFGEVNDEWQRPAAAVQPGAKAKAVASVTPTRFDPEQFSADPRDRIYAPADAGSDSSGWTLAGTEARDDYAAALYPTPKRRLPWRGLLLLVLALLLLALLVSQLLWPQRAALREDPQWGSWVEAICTHVDCQLPPRFDKEKIELLQRSVLKDRDDPRKLQIDLLIVNNASFGQPYPDINLRFTNIEGGLVAERRFQPAEYLREQPDSDQMPVAVPVHIAFSVRAPAGNITGFEFDFLPPQPR